MSDIYNRLAHFIRNEMRMSHIYQPVMFRKLLNSAGSASVKEIAQALLAYDTSQIEYYELITKRMVGKVLTNSRGITSKTADGFYLNGSDALLPDEIASLTALCEQAIADYIDKRGEAIWSHRKMSAGIIPGSARYEVLKRAKYRCELCGISAEEKALEVDHILPRNLGGSDELHNFQALCYSCNATKRDRDDTDFRGIGDSYKDRDAGCAFCELPAERVLAQNELALAIRDGFPVTEGHTLIIPKRHVETFFELYQPEQNAMRALLEAAREALIQDDPTVSGFNLGVNVGEDAGQTIQHCHMHLIPRRTGDVANARGGVRCVIPDRQDY